MRYASKACRGTPSFQGNPNVTHKKEAELAVRFRAIVITVVLAVGALGLVAAPAHADQTSGPKCGNGVCVTVWNAYQGSNYIDEIDVEDQANPGLYATYVWTLSSYGVQAEATGYGAAAFHPDRSYAAGRCISGYVDGVTGSAPCWIVP